MVEKISEYSYYGTVAWHVLLLLDMKADVDTMERDLCKICMDNVINCVLLDCGHLVTCTKCGKRLAECPICRALVIRVVHIFRV